MRALGLEVLIIWLAGCACDDGALEGDAAAPDADVSGAPYAVAAIADGELRIYEGYPGIGYDIDRIEAGDYPDRSFVRIVLPVPDPDLGRTSHLDFTDAIPLTFWANLKPPPGCEATAGAWMRKWSAGDPGVAGTLDLQAVTGGYWVTVRFEWYGLWDGPCGMVPGGVVTQGTFLAYRL